MQLDDATTILGRADFFEVCDAEQRRLLAFASERKKYRAGSIVYQAGEVPEGAHVLVTGTVASYQEGDETNPFEITTQGAVLGAPRRRPHPRRARGLPQRRRAGEDKDRQLEGLSPASEMGDDRHMVRRLF